MTARVSYGDCLIWENLLSFPRPNFERSKRTPFITTRVRARARFKTSNREKAARVPSSPFFHLTFERVFGLGFGGRVNVYLNCAYFVVVNLAPLLFFNPCVDYFMCNSISQHKFMLTNYHWARVLPSNSARSSIPGDLIRESSIIAFLDCVIPLSVG